MVNQQLHNEKQNVPSNICQESLAYKCSVSKIIQFMMEASKTCLSDYINAVVCVIGL